MKRKGPLRIGKKTIAEQLRERFRRLPREHQDEPRRELAKALAELRGDLLEMEVEDQEDFRRYMEPMVATQLFRSFFETSGVAGLRELLEELDGAEREFGSGGPPMSPVHDSFSMLWGMVDVRVGIRGECIVSLVRALAPQLGLDAELVKNLDALEESRLGLFRVLEVEAPLVGESRRLHLRELVTDRTLWLQFVEDYDLHERELVLVRVTRLPEARARARQVSHISFATPYVLLVGTDPEWIDYLQRAAADLKQPLSESSYAAVMRGVGDRCRWLEYVFEGFVGSRGKNVVEVRGFPDRPQTLPQHPGYDSAQRHAIPPGTSTRERATILSVRLAEQMEDVLTDQPPRVHDAMRGFLSELQELGGDAGEWLQLLFPVVYYETGFGKSPALANELARDELDDDMREYLAAMEDGFCSVFEIVDVERGESLRMVDLIDGVARAVQERAGSMNCPTRVLFLARLVCYRGVWLIDGMYPRLGVPESRQPLLSELRRRLGTERLPRLRGKGVFELMRAWQSVESERERQRLAAPRPTFVTTTGEPLEWTTLELVFDPGDHASVLDAIGRLRGCVPDDDDETGTFTIHKAGVIEARLAVEPDLLRIESNARVRADRVLSRLRQKLPGVLASVGREVVPVGELQKGPPTESLSPSPDVQAALENVMRQRYEGFLDEPIPALDGHTPRQAARKPALHDRLDELMRGHEFTVSRQLGAGVIDFAAMRRKLRLPDA